VWASGNFGGVFTTFLKLGLKIFVALYLNSFPGVAGFIIGGTKTAGKMLISLPKQIHKSAFCIRWKQLCSQQLLK